jgi:hypothetical protein
MNASEVMLIGPATYRTRHKNCVFGREADQHHNADLDIHVIDETAKPDGGKPPARRAGRQR